MEDFPALHSRRALNLRFDIPISKTKGFWDALGQGRLVASRCKSCANVNFPPQADCPRCSKAEFEWVDLETTGRLLTFTNVLITPASFVDSGPYVIAIALLGDVKVLAWLEGVKPEDVKVGMPIKVEVRKPNDGSPYYVFVPA